MASFAWLIETRQAPIRYLSLDCCTWTENAWEAIRFARREDADAMILYKDYDKVARPLEHGWAD